MTAPPTTVVPAPAKLTVSLRVTGVRADGMHLLDAEMVTLELCDLVEIGPGRGLEVIWADTLPAGATAGGATAPAVPAGPDNLVARALAATGREASVRLTKRIPAGAGLGGGSADAAAILRWAGVRPDRDGLDLAASLGADVPFCLAGGRARVRGIGERVDPLPPVDLRVTLLLPPFGMSSAAVYRRWDELGGPGPGAAGAGAGGPNDLEAAALALEPDLARWREALGDATGAVPVLAGSGSTWFVEGWWPELEGPLRPAGWDGAPGAVVLTRTGRP